MAPQLLPVVKRARLSSPSSPRLPVEDIRNERVHAVLRCGVFAFLALDEAAAVLQSCRRLRSNARLLASALGHPSERPVLTTWLPDFENHLEQAQYQTKTKHAPVAAKLVSSAAFLQRSVLPLCFGQDPTSGDETKEFPSGVDTGDNKRAIVEEDDRIYRVDPVLIPLTRAAKCGCTSPTSPSLVPAPSSPTHSPALSSCSTSSCSSSASSSSSSITTSASASTSSSQWSRRQIQLALNQKFLGGGDAFVDDKRVAESRFAAHWDSIRVDRVSGRASCRLCDAVRDALARYQSQWGVAMRQFDLVARLQQEQWRSREQCDDEEIHARTERLRVQNFPADAYIRPECGHWEDARLLRHICQHGHFQAWAIGDTHARGVASPEALVRAVSPVYQRQCATLLRPLQQVLHRKCQVVGRIPHTSLLRLPDTDTAMSIEAMDLTTVEAKTVRTELVGGVERSSGIFCGVRVTYCVTRADN